jgi:DNA (cytosine-5)-methyltransferase 1
MRSVSNGTRPVRVIRSLLHQKGYWFRLHNMRLTEKPDALLAKYRTVVLIHGCFCHGCGKCDRVTRVLWTYTAFRLKKIEENRRRNEEVRSTLRRGRLERPYGGVGMRNGRHRKASEGVRDGDASWPVIDFFSGCGGMSCGFHRRRPFKLIAAVDAEMAKPCEGFGRLECNPTYEANIGITPLERDIAELDPGEFFAEVSAAHRLKRGDLTAFLCCPPCTDFSRAKPTNHLVDSERNSLVVRTADFVESFFPEFVLMENARELIRGNHPHHFRGFVRRLEQLGYEVVGEIHMLTKFGLPQIRERALVIASRVGPVKTLADLWDGWRVSEAATTVRHAIGHLASRPVAAVQADPSDPMHQCPGFATDIVRRRMEAIPPDGGSWHDLAHHPEWDDLLVDSMRDRIKRQDLGSHPDVYGRMAWDKPAPTIKRECAHVGNGRYAHPEQHLLLTVREMSLLNGFLGDYVFVAESLANRYRHIGDAVPPLISYQLSALVLWMKTGTRPEPAEWVLPGASLKLEDIRLDRATSIQRTLFS